MIEVWKTIHSFYANSLYPGFISLVTSLTHNPTGIYVLLAVLVIFSIIRAKVKIPKLQQILDFICGMIAILLFVVTYYSFSPAIDKFFNSIKIPATTKSSTGTQNTQTQNSAPSNPTQKQLYYSVGCYNCWNESCLKNGYSYGGYDANYYNYIRSLCQSCSCNSYRAQSFWK